MNVTVVNCTGCKACDVLVNDGSRIIACGITSERKWWCECTPRQVYERPGPSNVCTHLRAFGNEPVHPSEKNGETT